MDHELEIHIFQEGFPFCATFVSLKRNGKWASDASGSNWTHERALARANQMQADYSFVRFDHESGAVLANVIPVIVDHWR